MLTLLTQHFKTNKGTYTASTAVVIVCMTFIYLFPGGFPTAKSDSNQSTLMTKLDQVIYEVHEVQAAQTEMKKDIKDLSQEMTEVKIGIATLNGINVGRGIKTAARDNTKLPEPKYGFMSLIATQDTIPSN